jgi:7,8-dihydropterin-6-yl-methyl-4-(beta-D-ribofuranosyl)aminobenzene 5'-phosphate synthase
MKFTVLMDNTTILDKPYLSESGLSFFIETDDAKVVFDTGYSPVFLSNARKMGIDLTDITAVAISHGHNDHTYGLPALGKLLLRKGKRVPVMLHPAGLEKKYWRNNDGSLEEIGMPVSREALDLYFDVTPMEKVTKLGDRLYFMGAVPRVYPEANESIGLIVNQDNELVPDFVQDDTAIVFDGAEGLVVINGCAHSGLVNILHYTRELFPGKPIAAVIGGFHMLSKDPKWLKDMADKIKTYEPKNIYPCHCTDEASRAYLRGQFQVGATGVGTVLTFE